MATKRKRGSAWEYIVRSKALHGKPFSRTFHNEQEGDEYIARLEALLKRGIVPPELVQESPQKYKTLADVIDAYSLAVALPASDASQLFLIRKNFGGTRMSEVDYGWIESWVQRMKRVEKLSPSTIRHYVGALARGLDWVVRSQPSLLPAGNPARNLPKRNATYAESDKVAAGEGRVDMARDRRLQADEEERIRNILAGVKPEGRERPLELKHQMALMTLFDLALETAMRLRELYTLEIVQVALDQRTVFLDKTKNGDKRQVPLSSVADRVLHDYLDEIGEGGFKGRLFPWLQGKVTPDLLVKTTSLLSQQFGRIFSAAECDDLRFHDLRHEATSRLFERTSMTDLEIAKITGHKDPRMLMRYANLRGSNLAAKLW